MIGKIKNFFKKVAGWIKNTLRKKPKIGQMYVFRYDPKTKDYLPFYDEVPLVVVLYFTNNGFYGLNFHYLDPKNRRLLLDNLSGFYSHDKHKIEISYNQLLALSNTFWKFCFKRYLYDHMLSRLSEVPEDELEHLIDLPTTTFKKMSTEEVNKLFKATFGV